jgi:hypothetical protein
MPEHIPDQLNYVRTEVSKQRCSHGVPDVGRCDKRHLHIGAHVIHGQEVSQEEFYQGAYHPIIGWVLTDRKSLKPLCPTCGEELGGKKTPC